MRVPLVPFLLAVCLLSAPATLTAQQQLFPPASPVQASANQPIATAPTASSGRQLTQTLGSWELTPPDSASVLAGGGSLFGWLNVANAAISFNDAMSGSPIESAGYANADSGSLFEVTFTSGVSNGPGDDLVLLDAHFDNGIYEVSSDYDGFAASVVVDTGSGAAVATSPFYYEFNASGPFAASVVGVAIDLSALGVPAGASVTSLRMLTTNAACDPVSLARIAGGFTLNISTLVGGSPGTASVSGATPFGTVGIGFSLTGNGPTLMNTGPCGMMLVDLTPPVSVLPFLVADINGDASISSIVPAGASGITLYFQALDFSSCTLSNAVTTVVL
jgi:hypothetical protein